MWSNRTGKALATMIPGIIPVPGDAAVRSDVQRRGLSLVNSHPRNDAGHLQDRGIVVAPAGLRHMSGAETRSECRSSERDATPGAAQRMAVRVVPAGPSGPRTQVLSGGALRPTGHLRGRHCCRRRIGIWVHQVEVASSDSHPEPGVQTQPVIVARSTIHN